MLSRNAKLLLIVVVVLFIFANPAGAAHLLQHTLHQAGVFAHSLGIGTG